MLLTWGRRCKRASPQSVPTAIPAIGQRNIWRIEGRSRGASPRATREGKLMTKSAKEAQPKAEIKWPCLILTIMKTNTNWFWYHTWWTVHTHTPLRKPSLLLPCDCWSVCRRHTPLSIWYRRAGHRKVKWAGVIWDAWPSPKFHKSWVTFRHCDKVIRFRFNIITQLSGILNSDWSVFLIFAVVHCNGAYYSASK